MSDSWKITILNSHHQRNHFDCGEPALNAYLLHFAHQHTKKNISRTFVLTSDESILKIVGFYTLSAGSITFSSLPMEFQKKYPRYPFPIARIGRLAIDKSIQGVGLGEHLLMDAFYRCILLTEHIGIAGVVVDAKHDKAKKFYVKYGFHELTDSPLTLFIPIQNIKKSLPRS